MSQNKSNNNKTKRYDDYEDNLWKVIMHDYAEHEGKEIAEETDALKNDPAYQPSEDERKRFMKMIIDDHRKNKIRSSMKIAKKVLAKVAVVILVFILGFTVMFTTVEAFRVCVLNFFLTFEKEYVSVKLSEEEPTGIMYENLSNIYVPMYIPAGYWINQIENNPAFQLIEYINIENKFIKFYANESFITTNIDTENAETIKNITINGNNGIFVLKKEIATVSWSNDEKVFIVYAQLNEEEAIKIAKSVIFLE